MLGLKLIHVSKRVHGWKPFAKFCEFVIPVQIWLFKWKQKYLPFDSSNGLNRASLLISKVQWHSSECNFIRDALAISHWNQLENYLSNFLSKSPRGHWVKCSKLLYQCPSMKHKHPPVYDMKYANTEAQTRVPIEETESRSNRINLERVKIYLWKMEYSST